MRLLSWNVNYRVRRLDEQVAAIAAHAPDVVALQEINLRACGLYRTALNRAGFPHVADGFREHGAAYTGRRTRGVLLASRHPFTLSTAMDIPWRERVITAVIHHPAGDVEIHNAYVPTGGVKDPVERWLKIETMEGLYHALARECPRPRILCGDFNAPQLETADGEVITFGQKVRRSGAATLVAGWGARWDKGERDILVGLAAHDLRDVFRLVNGYGTQAYSWYARGVFGFRLDHVFASQALQPASCWYEQAVRLSGLSDHALMLADFAG